MSEIVFPSTKAGNEVDRAVTAALETIPAQLTTIGSKIDELESNKVDKEEGKSLISTQYIGKTDNPEFVYVKTDAEDKILWAIKTDGSIYYGAGVPKQVQEELAELAEVADNKVDKEEGKSLIDADYANGISYAENPEFIKVLIDNENKILAGVKPNGTIQYFVPVELTGGITNSNFVEKEVGKSLIDSIFAEQSASIEQVEYLYVVTDDINKLIQGVRKDGTLYVSKGEILSLNGNALDFNKANIKSVNIGNKEINYDVLLGTDKNVVSDTYQSVITELDAVMPTLVEIPAHTNDHTIEVNSQEDFDNINTSIINAINNGKKDILILVKGNFQFGENHIDSSLFPDCSDVGIEIIGVGSPVIIAKGKDYDCANPIAHTMRGFQYTYNESGDYEQNTNPAINTFICDGEAYNQFGDVYINEHDLTLVSTDEETGVKTYTLEVSPLCYKQLYVGAFLLISNGYRKDLGKVVSLDGNNIISIQNITYNSLDRDYSYEEMAPRFNIIGANDSINIDVENNHIYMPRIFNTVHECRATNFIKLTKDFKYFIVDSLNFNGNGIPIVKGSEGSTRYLTEPAHQGTSRVTGLITAEAGDFGCLCVRNCIFNNIKSIIFVCGGHTSETLAKNIAFNNNIAKNCFCDVFTTGRYSKNTNIIGNKINNCGYFANAQLLRLSGTDYYVAYNKITNFLYIGISIGLYKADGPLEELGDVKGIVEHNQLFQTKDNIIRDYGCCDGGAIYSTLYNTQAIIRNNVIRSYGGISMGGIKGIYCDDGSSGNKIYNNIILGINTGYSIHARLQNLAPASNTRNFIGYNIIDGYIFFVGKSQGADNADECIKAQNYVIKSNLFSKINNTIQVYDKEEDYIISGSDINNGKISVPYTYKDIITSLYKKNRDLLDLFTLKF